MFVEITRGTPYNRIDSRSLSRSIWANGLPSHGRSSCNTADRRFEPQAGLMGIFCAPFCPQSCPFQPCPHHYHLFLGDSDRLVTPRTEITAQSETSHDRTVLGA